MTDENIAQAEKDTTEQDVQKEETATSKEAEPKEPEEKSEGEPDGDAEQPDKPRKAPRAEKRIAQLTYQIKELERKLNAVESRPVESKQEAEKIIKPTLESVGYDESKYAEALDNYYRTTIRNEVRSELENTKKTETEKSQREQMAQKSRDFYSKGIEIADDFLEVISDESLPVPPSLAEALFDLDNGAQVLYHLATQTPDELSRIAGLSPTKQAVEIGRLEARLTMPQPKKTSSAPAPIKPLSAGGESVTKHPDKMSMAEYAKWRQSQGN